MSLENLLQTGQLKEHPVDGKEIRKLLTAARRSLKDAGVDQISLELRFDAAYNSILQSALVALMVNGYRPSTNQPGHHMTIIQLLPKTLGIPGKRLAVLDTLRRKRNVTNYIGEDIDDGSFLQCVKEAERLLEEVSAWLAKNHSELI
jgi:hypothetical protein